jgi:uracil-DNA glycosylase family 4|tara:strand:- start:1383 stop:2057 length:675 start_codon:yes stop_codon:yes gene_type:complete
MNLSFDKLNKTITKCNKCPRLVKFRKKISKEKRKQYMHETYWGKPITGFGDSNGKILFVGLAPAAHGGTRTGRVFTGDKSSDFLYKCLHNANISNQSTSVHLNDGLKLKNAFITTALKCVPPGDKPLKIELDNCFSFFNQEINKLKNLKVIVALGKIAFDACSYFYQSNYNFLKKIKFGHDTIYKLPNNILLVGCYHPSPRNVNTGRIDEEKMTNLFKKIQKLV